MILFKEDWNRYPRAIVDTNTKNESFIRISALLRDMGIDNHTFPLQLLNPELQGVDPYDTNLTIEQMAMVTIEAKCNIFYYAREIVRDPNGSIYNPIKFKANRGNIATFWLFCCHITTIIEIGRQQGKSFTADTIGSWLVNLAYTNSNISLLTKDDKLRSINLDRLKNLINELPYYLNQLKKNDIANTEELHINSLNNKYKGMLSSMSPKSALKVGRGGSAPAAFVDEIPFIPNIAIALPAMLAAGTALRDIAKSKGEPYGTLIYSTSGKKDDKDGKYVYDLISNSVIMTEKLYDVKDMDALKDTIRKNSTSGQLRVYASFTHRQLGYTDEWLKQKMAEAESKGEDAARDFLLLWTSGSQKSPLSAHLANTIRESEEKDYYTEISFPYSYITRWYIRENHLDAKMRSTKTVMSLDSSEAIGQDDLGLHLRDVKTGETLSSGNYNETNLITFAEWLCNTLVKYDNITLIIERRSTGGMIIDYLLLMLPSKGIDPFKRLYNKVVQEADENKERFKEITKNSYTRSHDVYVKYKSTFGFSTSGSGSTSRSELYSTTLLNAAKITGSKVKDTKTINQIISLEERNGRVDHPEGEHDDLVIAWLLSYWLLSKGKNLHYYGINTREILVDNLSYNEINDPRILYEKRQQDELRNNIDNLLEEIKKQKDEFMAYKLESQLRILVNKLSDTDREILGIEELLNKLKDARSLNRRRYW